MRGKQEKQGDLASRVNGRTLDGADGLSPSNAERAHARSRDAQAQPRPPDTVRRKRKSTSKGLSTLVTAFEKKSRLELIRKICVLS